MYIIDYTTNRPSRRFAKQKKKLLLRTSVCPFFCLVLRVKSMASSGAGPKLILSIDIGTTFSAASFCIVDSDKDKKFVEVSISTLCHFTLVNVL